MINDSNGVSGKLWWLCDDEVCSDILDVVTWEISAADVLIGGLDVSACSWFDPHVGYLTCGRGSEEIGSGESVEFL